MTNTETLYQLGFTNKSNGTIGNINIEEICKSTELHESSEDRFGAKFFVGNKSETIEFIYGSMLYISMDDATEIFEESI